MISTDGAFGSVFYNQPVQIESQRQLLISSYKNCSYIFRIEKWLAMPFSFH